MAQPAQVTSVEAIESFRAALIVYLGKARAALDEVNAEVVRVRGWLETEQRRKWEQELRLLRRRLEEAQSELFSARLSPLQEPSALHFMAVQRTERAVKEAEAKLTVVKKWDREMQDKTEPLIKQIEQLQGYLATDMGKAVLHLGEVVKVLDAYAEKFSPATPAKGAVP